MRPHPTSSNSTSFRWNNGGSSKPRTSAQKYRNGDWPRSTNWAWPGSPRSSPDRNVQFLDTAWMFDSRPGLEYSLALARSRLAFELGQNLEYWIDLPDQPRHEAPLANARFDETDMLLLGPYFNLNWSS